MLDAWTNSNPATYRFVRPTCSVRAVLALRGTVERLTRINAVSVRQLYNSTMIGIWFLRRCRGLAVWMLLGVSSSPAFAGADVARGEVLVRTNCSPCHAFGPTDTSPHPDAPAFRTLSKHYPIEDLAESLAEGISSGHPDMPEFVASPDQIDAIIAYIGSLQRK